MFQNWIQPETAAGCSSHRKEKIFPAELELSTVWACRHVGVVVTSRGLSKGRWAASCSGSHACRRRPPARHPRQLFAFTQGPREAISGLELEPPRHRKPRNPG